MTLTPEEEFRLLNVEEGLAGVRKTVARWRVNGAEGFFQGGGLRFGQFFDIGRESLQLLVDNTSSAIGNSRGIVYFLPQSTGFPITIPPATGSYAQIGSSADPALHAFVDITAYSADRVAYSNFLVHSGATVWQAVDNFYPGSMQLWPKVTANGVGVLYLSTTGGGAVNLQLQGGTSDLASNGAGSFGYRTDTSKFRGYTASWDNFAMEAWVTAAVATGDESYAHALMLGGM